MVRPDSDFERGKLRRLRSFFGIEQETDSSSELLRVPVPDPQSSPSTPLSPTYYCPCLLQRLPELIIEKEPKQPNTQDETDSFYDRLEGEVKEYVKRLDKGVSTDIESLEENSMSEDERYEPEHLSAADQPPIRERQRSPPSTPVESVQEYAEQQKGSVSGNYESSLESTSSKCSNSKEEVRSVEPEDVENETSDKVNDDSDMDVVDERNSTSYHVSMDEIDDLDNAFVGLEDKKTDDEEHDSSTDANKTAKSIEVMRTPRISFVSDGHSNNFVSRCQYSEDSIATPICENMQSNANEIHVEVVGPSNDANSSDERRLRGNIKRKKRSQNSSSDNAVERPPPRKRGRHDCASLSIPPTPPILESPRSPSTSPTPTFYDNCSSSPLPDLIIEEEPENPNHDEPDRFYDELQIEFKKCSKRLYKIVLKHSVCPAENSNLEDGPENLPAPNQPPTRETQRSPPSTPVNPTNLVSTELIEDLEHAFKPFPSILLSTIEEEPELKTSSSGSEHLSDKVNDQTGVDSADENNSSSNHVSMDVIDDLDNAFIEPDDKKTDDDDEHDSSTYANEPVESLEVMRTPRISFDADVHSNHSTPGRQKSNDIIATPVCENRQSNANGNHLDNSSIYANETVESLEVMRTPRISFDANVYSNRCTPGQSYADESHLEVALPSNDANSSDERRTRGNIESLSQNSSPELFVLTEERPLPRNRRSHDCICEELMQRAQVEFVRTLHMVIPGCPYIFEFNTVECGGRSLQKCSRHDYTFEDFMERAISEVLLNLRLVPSGIRGTYKVIRTEEEV